MLVAGFAATALIRVAAQQPPGAATGAATPDGYRFKSGVELINVTATVSDSSGRFVSGLTRDDFVIYEDGRPQDVSYFSADRVPVSLGVVLDTSGSMAGEKIEDAKSALDRFVYDLLDTRDEVFLYRFSDHPELVQDWTTDRSLLARSMSRISPNGGTAMYDAIVEAIPRASEGRHQKKAIVVISDGNDTSSIASLSDARDRVRGSDVLVYAVGIDGVSPDSLRRPPPRPRNRAPVPFPRPPFGGRPRGVPPVFPQIFGPGAGQRPGQWQSGDDRVNVDVLRQLTNESGGRTELVRYARDLDPATASIADELSKQYSLGYASGAGKDGRWHSISVEIRNHSYRVRARQGYVAG